jgi:hypothetical protein
VKPLTNAVHPAQENARYDSLLNANYRQQITNTASRSKKHINYYDLAEPMQRVRVFLGAYQITAMNCIDKIFTNTPL